MKWLFTSKDLHRGMVGGGLSLSISDNPPRTATPNSLHEEPEIIRQVEKIRTEEVTNIEDADYDAEVTARLEESVAHLEVAEVLQALRIGQQERQESSKAGSLYSDYAAQQFSDVESTAPRHNSTEKTRDSPPPTVPPAKIIAN